MPSQPLPPPFNLPWYGTIILLVASPFLLTYDRYYVWSELRRRSAGSRSGPAF